MASTFVCPHCMVYISEALSVSIVHTDGILSIIMFHIHDCQCMIRTLVNVCALCMVHMNGFPRSMVHTHDYPRCMIHMHRCLQCMIHIYVCLQCMIHLCGCLHCMVHTNGCLQCRIHLNGRSTDTIQLKWYAHDSTVYTSVDCLPRSTQLTSFQTAVEMSSIISIFILSSALVQTLSVQSLVVNRYSIVDTKLNAGPRATAPSR